MPCPLMTARICLAADFFALKQSSQNFTALATFVAHGCSFTKHKLHFYQNSWICSSQRLRLWLRLGQGLVLFRVKFIFREYSRTLKRIFVIFREWKYVSMYTLTCTLLLTYPTQTPLLFSGSRLDRQWFLRFICAQWRNDRIYARISMLFPCYKGVQDPVSFTVTTGLLGRLGLGLRVMVSIRIISTFLSEFIINLFRYCNKSRYERHLSNVSLNDQSKFSRKIVSCGLRLP